MIAVAAAPAYAKTAREMIASVIPLVASVPTKAKLAASESRSKQL